MDLQFQPGKNIAMKVPTHEHQDTVHFYRDVLRLKEISSGNSDDTPRFEFGDKVLWLDCETGISQSEIWLEIVTNILTRRRNISRRKDSTAAMTLNPCRKVSRHSGFQARPILFIWYPSADEHSAFRQSSLLT